MIYFIGDEEESQFQTPLLVEVHFLYVGSSLVTFQCVSEAMSKRDDQRLR